jgi:hypothetical protein
MVSISWFASGSRTPNYDCTPYPCMQNNPAAATMMAGSQK